MRIIQFNIGLAIEVKVVFLAVTIMGYASLWLANRRRYGDDAGCRCQFFEVAEGK